MKISKYIMEKIEEFADLRIKGSEKLYKNRGEPNVVKIRQDIIIGAMGEWAVFRLLKDRGFEFSKPDMKIYEKRQKSFSADLSNADYDIHVKSQGQTSITRYGHSWLLQRSDSLVRNPSHGEWLAFTAVDVDSREVEIKGFCLASVIKENDLFEECQVPRFRFSKVALYMDSLEEFGLVEKCIK
jgi:hypothetical protein